MEAKERARLRGLANGLETVLHVGKDGVGESLIRQAEITLEARELVKGRVLDNCMDYTPRTAAEALAQATGSEVVQVIGSKFVLYRRKREEPVEKNTARTGRPDRPRHTGGPDHPRHTGKPDHPRHTGGPDHPRHTGKPDHPRHTGGPDHPRHTGGPDHPRHTGGPDHPRHMGKPDHPRHTGGPDHPRHTGGPDHPRHTGKPYRPRHTGKPDGRKGKPSGRADRPRKMEKSGNRAKPYGARGNKP